MCAELGVIAALRSSAIECDECAPSHRTLGGSAESSPDAHRVGVTPHDLWRDRRDAAM